MNLYLSTPAPILGRSLNPCSARQDLSGIRTIHDSYRSDSRVCSAEANQYHLDVSAQSTQPPCAHKTFRASAPDRIPRAARTVFRAGSCDRHAHICGPIWQDQTRRRNCSSSPNCRRWFKTRFGEESQKGSMAGGPAELRAAFGSLRAERIKVTALAPNGEPDDPCFLSRFSLVFFLDGHTQSQLLMARAEHEFFDAVTPRLEMVL